MSRLRSCLNSSVTTLRACFRYLHVSMDVIPPPRLEALNGLSTRLLETSCVRVHSRSRQFPLCQINLFFESSLLRFWWSRGLKRHGEAELAIVARDLLGPPAVSQLAPKPIEGHVKCFTHKEDTNPSRSLSSIFESSVAVVVHTVRGTRQRCMRGDRSRRNRPCPRCQVYSRRTRGARAFGYWTHAGSVRAESEGKKMSTGGV